MPRAALVVDLGFGDAGKGLVTDHLTRALGASLVVRFNGGAQAGHNVVTPDGRHHTFAQIGAGAFVPGVRTFLSAHVVVHPTALAVEAAHLARAGVPDPLSRVHVSARAPLVTPFHQAANRLREMARGRARHGSCGVGVGEVMADLAEAVEVLRAGDLPAWPRAALRRIQERKRAELDEVVRALRGDAAAEREIAALEGAEVGSSWLGAAGEALSRAVVVDDAWLGRALRAAPAAVFEGAQGVLLDEWAGFHPYTTWSTCTFANALELLAEHRFEGEVTRVGVLRTYVVRHGAGPLPTEDGALAALLPEAHNETGPWQGAVRRGHPDAVLARYAAEVSGGVDALALTHLDALGRVPAWRVCRRYRVSTGDAAALTEGRIPAPVGRDLERQAALAAGLERAEAVLEEVDWRGEPGVERARAFFEEAVGAPVRWEGWGPSSAEVRGG